MPITEKTKQQMSNPCSSELNLSEQAISEKDLETLMELLKKHPHIKRLNLSGNDIDLAGAKLLAESGCELEELNISNNRIGNKGYKLLADSNRFKKIVAHGNGISIQTLMQTTPAKFFSMPTIKTPIEDLQAIAQAYDNSRKDGNQFRHK